VFYWEVCLWELAGTGVSSAAPDRFLELLSVLPDLSTGKHEAKGEPLPPNMAETGLSCFLTDWRLPVRGQVRQFFFLKGVLLFAPFIP